MHTSPFAFALCQPGMERWLKEEVARTRPDLRPAFQRPGRVTFKCTGAPFGPDERPESVFARAWGCSAGLLPDSAAILEVGERVGATLLWLSYADPGIPGETHPIHEGEAMRDSALRRLDLERLAPGRYPLYDIDVSEGEARDGEMILDVITAWDEPALVGWHVHGPGRHLGAAGRWNYPRPEDLPSRAWEKVTEGLFWAGSPVRPGDLVVEFGAAPGGGTRAFVEAGARVVAIDPQPLAPAVLAMPGVTFIRRAIGDVTLEELPRDVQWIACDAGIAPVHVIAALRRLVAPWRRTLRGLVLTLKLNDAATIAALPELLDRIRALGCARVRATQLPANRRDVFVFAEF